MGVDYSHLINTHWQSRATTSDKEQTKNNSTPFIMKQTFTFFAILLMALAMPKMANAYDVSAVSPSGQMLYYEIINGNARIVRPVSGTEYINYVSGDLIIPDSVSYNGITYAVTSIGRESFRNCTSLVSVVIPNTVSAISPYAFFDCQNLVNVTLGNGVNVIWYHAFSSCYSLANLYVPDSVIEIGGNAFADVRHIEYYGSATGAPWGAISMNGVVDGDFCYSDSTKHYLCAYIGSDESVSIPSTVDSIGDMAFYHGTLCSVLIPSSVVSIGSSVFKYCWNLGSIIIPNNVSHIESAAFSGIRHIEYYGNASGAPWGAISMNGITEGDFNYSDGTKHYLRAYIGTGGDVVIPTTVDSVGEKAFYGCAKPFSVSFSGGVSYMGNNAFLGCAGLNQVNYTGTIAEWCDIDFANKYSNPLSYSHSMTNQGVPVTNLIIPDGVIAIKPYAFYGFSTLSSVTVGSGVATISGVAFSECSGLEYIRMKPLTPPSLQPQYAFLCDSIIDLVVPRESYNLYTSAATGYTRNHIHKDSIYVFCNWNNVEGDILGYDSVYAWPYPDTITFIAVPHYGYHFAHWSSSGYTDSIYHQTMISTDFTIYAHFSKNQYTVWLSPDTNLHGNCTGHGAFDYLSEVTIEANSNYGYHFSMWSDGNTNNPRTLILTQDTHIVAYYNKNIYTLTFSSDNTNLGIVNITNVSGEYLDTSMYIYATAIPHYHLTHWNDGNTENPRRFIFTGNKTYTASFGIDTHSVSVQTNNIAYGTAQGGGEFIYGTAATVWATPFSGYQFSHWSDGSTYNPYTFAVLEDKTLTAYFVVNGTQWQDTVIPSDTTHTILHDTIYIYVPYVLHDTTFVTDTVIQTDYIPVHDTTYVDVPYPVHDTTLVHDTTYVDVPYPVHDTTTIVDTMTITDTITLVDTLWLTQYDTVWLHDTITTHDTIYIHDEGIDGVDALNAKVYSSDGQIVVEGADGYAVTLFDVNGRMLATKQDYGAEIRFDVSTSGTYMIKIGSYPARKVVVIR